MCPTNNATSDLSDATTKSYQRVATVTLVPPNPEKEMITLLSKAVIIRTNA